ncbi:hypothetical protein FEM48_Zijuj08G0185400 [Ziziphus jujuba var. spinosa]|uniref:Peroxisomal ATPase PEX1 n=1 Tax=Ziziphus jujuba var. spinosa TaxID=714518 RepID=A0A978V0P3_ZIZJJ|nr:hypothetical protein FEM48_Zijuj08G0185400 [Ziziphus jujuba var. spinosa]
MELEVKLVAGIENCFVSLPLLLIQTLQSSSQSHSGLLGEVLALELRSRTSDDRWVVAWSGATSSSSGIEIAQQFAECISLGDRTKVQVRALSNVPRATLVTIEPNNEDDWEVLELNSEVAEAAILKQVRIVQEAMRFPLWLHGSTSITFLVTSTFPKKAVGKMQSSSSAQCYDMLQLIQVNFTALLVLAKGKQILSVQLVPGTEVAVAPKRRKKNVNLNEDMDMLSSSNENVAKALVRIQDADKRFICKNIVKGVELGVSLTSVAIIHPETAKKFSLDSLQLVFVVPRLPLKERITSSGNDALRVKSSSTSKGAKNGTFTDRKEQHQAIVRLLISDSVAEGHVMIAQCLRVYLRASLHSCASTVLRNAAMLAGVYLKGCNVLKKDIPSLSLSPCHFKMPGKEKASEKNGLEVLHSHKNHKKKDMLIKPGSGTYMEIADWSTYDEVIAALSYESHSNQDEKVACQSDNRNGLQSLLKAWFLAQLDAISSHTGEEVNSLVLGHETLLHFEVTNYKFGAQVKVQASCNGTLESRNETRELPVQILYSLTTAEESHHGGYAYELVLDEKNRRSNSQGGLAVFENVEVGDPVAFNSVSERIFNEDSSCDISSLSWMGTSTSDVINSRVNSVVISCFWDVVEFLSSSSPWTCSDIWASSILKIVLHQPRGSGKTLLARGTAKSLQEHEDLLAHIVFVSCSRLASEKALTIRHALSGYISEALDHAPSLVILDDLDSIISSSSDTEGSQPSGSVISLTEFLIDIMDEYGEKRKISCGIGPLAFAACVQSLESIPQSLSSSGRFDFHIQLPAPAAKERVAILKHEIQRRCLQCSDSILVDVASKCDGYDAYDLVRALVMMTTLLVRSGTPLTRKCYCISNGHAVKEILVDRTIHAAVGRFMPYLSADEDEKATLNRDDFSRAMHDFLPVAMRDITKSASEGGRSGWDDVGGLTDIQKSIREMIEFPSKFPNIFAQAPLRLRSNVLLYGPPGCGKTHIVGAAAAACSLRFISIKGPELLNKYIGASEQAVRDIFSKAAAAAPCLLFFDEFDSIAPKRGHDNTGVTDRVVNQFLTELDGVEVLTGVFVFAATSRPDLLDAALLRPGRLDRLLYCGFPSERERLDILTVLSRKLPLADDVDLAAVASITEGFSGADLQALLSDAQLAAVHELLGGSNKNEPGKNPVITNGLLKSTASKARPSVSKAEKERLDGIYRQFLDSKRPVAEQVSLSLSLSLSLSHMPFLHLLHCCPSDSRDAKGKRATLA